MTATEGLGRALTEAGLRLDVGGGVATITLDRPERRNAQTPATWRALARIGATLPADVRVVVLRGAGAAFSAGLDRAMWSAEGLPGEVTVPEMAAMQDGAAEDLIATYQAGFTWLRDPAFVSVAAVHGHAIGAGFQLALACDLRVAADDAQFTMKEPALGLVPDLGGTGPLVDLVGYPRALEICATARQVGAAEAAALGLVELVVRPDQLDATVDDLVAALLATNREAVEETKALLLGARGRSPEAQLLAERQAQVRRIRALAALAQQG